LDDEFGSPHEQTICPSIYKLVSKTVDLLGREKLLKMKARWPKNYPSSNWGRDVGEFKNVNLNKGMAKKLL